MELSLNGKHALVAGSTQGIGLAVALELAQQGATVTLIARNQEKLSEIKDKLPRPDNQIHKFVTADFSKPTFIKELIANYISNNKSIDILINNTGGPPAGPVTESKVEDFLLAFNQHLIMNQILTQAVLPSMKEKKFGRIINIISTSVKQPIIGLGVSNTIRGAVANWSKTLASEVGKFGITVNNILPGSTKTQRLDSILKSRAKKQNKSIEEVTNDMLKDIPAGRFGEAEEIAYAVAFLASESASYISGINLPIDGGRLKVL
ncbi:MAG: Bacilysin biosynthesis oxidoreductase YwfH [Candidatus Heimdallarchaeota archaeon LC_3]|nr:MAG: Bacilysin biosynthesis oxidoreductase YwfH [Candidatus Heimdallarchaeota archaeon LC_3]